MASAVIEEIRPAFRFELIQALRLLISSPSESAQIIRANHPEFVSRWYDVFADLRSDIDAVFGAGSYWLCRALLNTADSLEGVRHEMASLLDRLSAGPAADTLEQILPTERAAWRRAVAAAGSVLPEFHARCFAGEWARWQPALNAAAGRFGAALQPEEVLDAIEAFAGREFGPLRVSVHPSEFVRPSAFLLDRGTRLAVVLQHQIDEIWLLVTLVHETGHRLFRHPDWHDDGTLTTDDLIWVESLLPPGWQDTGYSQIRYYLEESFLEALAFAVALQLLPHRDDEVRDRARRDFEQRRLVLAPFLLQATESDYSPQAFGRYDRFVASLVAERALRAGA